MYKANLFVFLKRNDHMYNINPAHLLYKDKETNFSEGDQLFTKQLGYIEITSGHIVACVPFVSKGDQSFSKKVYPGISYSTSS